MLICAYFLSYNFRYIQYLSAVDVQIKYVNEIYQYVQAGALSVPDIHKNL